MVSFFLPIKLFQLVWKHLLLSKQWLQLSNCSMQNDVITRITFILHIKKIIKNYILKITASTLKYLFSDWLSMMQYCSCCTLNIALWTVRNNYIRLSNASSNYLNTNFVLIDAALTVPSYIDFCASDKHLAHNFTRFSDFAVLSVT